MLPFRIPSRQETASAIVIALLITVLIDPIAAHTATVLGAGESSSDSLNSLSGTLVLAVSAILIAPIVEEILFRGVVFDAIRVRYSATIAIVGSSLFFGGIHLLIGGVSGVVFSTLSGVLFGWMRLQYDNLTGPTLAHALGNTYSVVVMAGYLPAFFA
ncbi:hypothetical protein AUR64_14505 [Haloprofundus marisrubri]|uniref:CAAX prenyl protease 2/Lysostaphin resistance protein A-like domain-containing protein n=2 Tax=Haloprofundus marisrubri TaxID=1514971 RepID=A0A0W1R7C5_9EURY|nr:hypothetical protein AUR64_14505 [Haloprofundus marisrubri]